jgi:hypothetical protein
MNCRYFSYNLHHKMPEEPKRLLRMNRQADGGKTRRSWQASSRRRFVNEPRSNIKPGKRKDIKYATPKTRFNRQHQAPPPNPELSYL